MDLFDLTLSTPAENLALDEALLDEAEQAAHPRETLRLWEATSPFVVVGRNSQVADEVRLAACRRRDLPILRRTSGGCAIVAAPGCLMYAVVLSYGVRPELRMLDEAHRFVMGTILRALRPFVPEAAHEGTCDLTLGRGKLSGNSMRCRRQHFLYHGTLLYDFPVELADECLTMPPRQPEYRRGRPNRSFLVNLPIEAHDLRQALIDAWRAEPADRDWPRRRVETLVSTRYSRPEWNFRR